MARCEKCNIEINYLPFRCKYCGKYFCREHRLPENHSCTGHYNVPKVDGSLIEKPIQTVISPLEIKDSRKKLYQDSDYEQEKKRFKLRNRRFSPARWYQFRASNFGQYMATHIFLIVFITFDILALIFGPGIVLSPGYFFWKFYIHTILTAILVPFYGDIFLGIILLPLMLYVFYLIGRQMERRFGYDFLIKFVFICGILTGAIFLLVTLLFSLIPGFEILSTTSYGIQTHFGFYIGVATFFAVLMPQQAFQLIFPPIKLKARSLAIIFILISVGSGFLIWASYDFVPLASIYLCSSLANLGGALGGYLLALHNRGRFSTRPPPVQFITSY